MTEQEARYIAALLTEDEKQTLVKFLKESFNLKTGGTPHEPSRKAG